MKIIIKFLAIYLLLVGVSANAATLISDGTYWTSITGLDVDGTLYDVTFLDGSYDDIRDPESSFYAGDIDLTYSLVEAISYGAALDAFLDSSEDNGGTFFNGCTTSSCYLSMPVMNNTLASIWYYTNNDTTRTTTSTLTDSGINYTNATYAYFKVSAVPLPAAVWLMGSGLLGLLGFGRKNKVQVVAA